MTAPEITLTGIVTASMWNEKDEVTKVTIAVDGEKEYIIEKNSFLVELIRLIRQEVEVTGTVTIGANGKNCLWVSSYRLVR